MNAQEAGKMTEKAIMDLIMYEIECSAKAGLRHCTLGCSHLTKADRDFAVKELRSVNYTVIEIDCSNKLAISW